MKPTKLPFTERFNYQYGSKLVILRMVPSVLKVSRRYAKEQELTTVL